MDPDQTASTGVVVWSGSTMFVEEASKTFHRMAKADDLCCE